MKSPFPNVFWWTSFPTCFLVFTKICVIILLSNKHPPCWSFRLFFHYSFLLCHTIKIMTILLSVSIMTMYFTTCLAQKSCQDVSLLKVMWCLHFIVETLFIMVSVTNKNNFLMSRNKNKNIFNKSKLLFLFRSFYWHQQLSSNMF